MSQFFEITPDMLDDPQETLAEILRQDMEKRNNAAYEEMAQVIVKYFPNMVCTGRGLQDRITELVKAEERLQQSDCPTCGKYPTCYHNHGRHGVVRINCPLWRPKA